MNKHLCIALAGSVCALATATPAVAADEPLAFNHFMVAMSVGDIEAETAWYTEKLGFTVEKDASVRDGAVHFRWLTNGNERIELIQSMGSEPGTPRPKPPGHAAIRGITQVTLATDDLAAVKAALAAKGVTPALDITEVAPLGIKVMYLTDPEGNAVEIAQVLPAAAG